MYLFINLSEKDNIHLALFDEQNYQEKKYHGQNRELLECIDDILLCTKVRNNTKLRITDVNGIMCVVGAGGFTSTRVAAVVTNTLAYTLWIPVLAITTKQIKSVQKLIPHLLKQPIGRYISPTYSGEPNIGKRN